MHCNGELEMRKSSWDSHISRLSTGMVLSHHHHHHHHHHHQITITIITIIIITKSPSPSSPSFPGLGAMCQPFCPWVRLQRMISKRMIGKDWKPRWSLLIEKDDQNDQDDRCQHKDTISNWSKIAIDQNRKQMQMIKCKSTQRCKLQISYFCKICCKF